MNQPKFEQPKSTLDIIDNIQSLALKSELSGSAKKYLDKLVASLNQVLAGRTTRQMFDQQDVAGLEKYLELVKVINKLLKNQEVPDEKEDWDWEPGRRVIFDVAELEMKYPDQTVYSPQFSADGENYLVSIHDDKNENDPNAVLIKNGQELAYSKGVRTYIQSLSPDGQAVAMTYVKDNGNTGVMLDGRDLGVEFNEVQNISFTPDSWHLLIEAQNRKIADLVDGVNSYITTKSVIMVDNKIRLESDKEYDMFTEPIMDSVSKKIACVVIDENGWTANDNGHKWPRSFNECHCPIYSPDSKNLATIVAVDENHDTTVAVNGQLSWQSRFEGWSGRLAYSPDGSKLALGAMPIIPEDKPNDFEDYSYGVYENDKRVWPEKFHNVENLVYAPDSENLAAVVETASWQRTIVINGEQLFSPVLNIQNLIFSPDGKKIMFIVLETNKIKAKNKYYRLVMDIERYLY